MTSNTLAEGGGEVIEECVCVWRGGGGGSRDDDYLLSIVQFPITPPVGSKGNQPTGPKTTHCSTCYSG